MAEVNIPVKAPDINQSQLALAHNAKDASRPFSVLSPDDSELVPAAATRYEVQNDTFLLRFGGTEFTQHLV